MKHARILSLRKSVARWRALTAICAVDDTPMEGRFVHEASQRVHNCRIDCSCHCSLRCCRGQESGLPRDLDTDAIRNRYREVRPRLCDARRRTQPGEPTCTRLYCRRARPRGFPRSLCGLSRSRRPRANSAWRIALSSRCRSAWRAHTQAQRWRDPLLYRERYPAHGDACA